MRNLMVIVLALLTAAVVFCARDARLSRKPLSDDVSLLLFSLTLPILGNLLIIASGDWLPARIGCYVYYIGLDNAIFFLLRFCLNYCRIDLKGSKLQKIVVFFIVVDGVQLLLNPFTGHAFTTEAIMVDGAPYHMLVPLAGQQFHRLVAYGLFFVSIILFTHRTITSSRFYVERYGVILAAMVATGLWETYYIFSRTPIDRAMLGFGFFGLAVYYLTIHYRPTHLLDQLLGRVVSDMSDAVLFFDSDHECIYVNSMAEGLLHVKSAADLSYAAERAAELLGTDKIELGNNSSHRYMPVGKDGRQSFYRVDTRNVDDTKGLNVGCALTIHDRTHEEVTLRRERYLARHDHLTGLYNQEYLYTRIHESIKKTPGVAWTLAAVDVKDFKLINDIYNNEVGDRVLSSIADRMRSEAFEGEIFGRISGDRFGFAVPTANFDINRIKQVLVRRHAIYVSHALDGESDTVLAYDDDVFDVSEGIDATTGYPIVVHVGIYEVTDSNLDVSIMFDRAFMAIQSIKDDYQRTVAIYDESMRDDAIWAQRLSGELDQAIKERQIRPYLQPMVDANGSVIGAEALVRWIHPEVGFLSPARFVPVFERNGRIAKLDAYIWECACQILRDWQEQGLDLFLSVNISPKDFYFIDVYQTICNLVEKYQIEPAKLRLEITETVMMSDMENRLRIIENLRQNGFLVEMDDFGSGYSSLNMLKDIPVDVLKIDMMFLYKTKDPLRAQTILQTIIDLSGNLGISSLTEGVETVEQRNMLLDMGCNMFQGYYFAKPMPREDFESFYHNRIAA